jgi:hypothetical protein
MLQRGECCRHGVHVALEEFEAGAGGLLRALQQLGVLLHLGTQNLPRQSTHHMYVGTGYLFKPSANLRELHVGGREELCELGV